LRKREIIASHSSSIPHRGDTELAKPVLAAISALASEGLFELSPDAILDTDSDGVIRAANSRSAELFARSLRNRPEPRNISFLALGAEERHQLCGDS